MEEATESLCLQNDKDHFGRRKKALRFERDRRNKNSLNVFFLFLSYRDI